MTVMLESNSPSYLFFVEGSGIKNTEKNEEKVAKSTILCN